MDRQPKEASPALIERVVGAAIEVHRELGPGLLESVYEAALGRELELAGARFERQVPVPVKYKGAELGIGFRVDIVVEDRLLIEIKATRRLDPVHEAQVLTYLRLLGIRRGILINFGEKRLKNGIRRLSS